MARGILAEIVRGMFLNSRAHLDCVAAIAAQSKAMSTRAAPGFWSPKNNQDHATFSANCTPNSVNDPRAAAKPPCRQTNQAAIAMHRYSADHTGPKIQFGGFQVGFARVAYQVAIFGVVTAPPIPAAAKQTTRNTTRPSQGCLGGMVWSLIVNRRQ